MKSTVQIFMAAVIVTLSMVQFASASTGIVSPGVRGFPQAIPNQCNELRARLGPENVYVGKFAALVRNAPTTGSVNRWACFATLRECKTWLGDMGFGSVQRFYVNRCDRGATGRSIWWKGGSKKRG